MHPISDFLKLTVSLSTPLILAAMGGFTSERSGVINIGLEGMMLMACCAAALGSIAFGAVGGVASGVAAATILSLLHWLLTQQFRIDHVISGMAINAIALGGTNFLWGKFSDPNRAGGFSHLPLGMYWTVALLVPFGLALYVRQTRGGLRMLAVGSDPSKARLMGVQPLSIRFWGLLGTGILTGLAGAMLVSDTQVFTDDMTSGRGYIALAALILGGWRPIPAMMACVAFGALSAMRLELQGTTIAGVQVPTEAWQALPYLATVIALAGFLGKNRTPSGLGKL